MAWRRTEREDTDIPRELLGYLKKVRSGRERERSPL